MSALGAVLRCTARGCVLEPPAYPFLGVLARPWLREMQYARPWHDLTLHTAGRRDRTALILTINLTLPWWEATQLAGWLEVRFLLGSPELFGVFDGFERCAAGFEPSNPVPLPRAPACSVHARLRPLQPDCVGCCGR